MVVNKLAHHLDTLVHFPACTLLGNYEVSKIGNSWKLRCVCVCTYIAEGMMAKFGPSVGLIGSVELASVGGGIAL